MSPQVGTRWASIENKQWREQMPSGCESHSKRYVPCWAHSVTEAETAARGGPLGGGGTVRGYRNSSAEDGVLETLPDLLLKREKQRATKHACREAWQHTLNREATLTSCPLIATPVLWRMHLRREKEEGEGKREGTNKQTN